MLLGTNGFVSFDMIKVVYQLMEAERRGGGFKGSNSELIVDGMGCFFSISMQLGGLLQYPTITCSFEPLTNITPVSSKLVETVIGWLFASLERSFVGDV